MFVKSAVKNKLDLYINNMVQCPAVNNHPKCKDLVVSYGQWSQGTSSRRGPGDTSTFGSEFIGYNV